MDLAAILSACTVPPLGREPGPMLAMALASQSRAEERLALTRVLATIADYEPIERRSAILRLGL